MTRDNVSAIPAAAGSPDFGALDLLSVDVDGNDLAIADAAIKAWSPKIVIGEYNAKFPPPLQLEVDYDPQASLGAAMTTTARRSQPGSSG